jgi:hypothetical protein
MCRVHPSERVEVPLALTTPERFEDALRTHAGATIAAEASELVGKLDPTLSVRGGPTSRETLSVLLSLAALAALASIGTCLALGFFSAILDRWGSRRHSKTHLPWKIAAKLSPHRMSGGDYQAVY